MQKGLYLRRKNQFCSFHERPQIRFGRADERLHLEILRKGTSQEFQ